MQVRSYQPGDEIAQVEIYNQATRELPGHKPATVDEVRRRYLSPGFDADSKLFAVEGGRIIGYVSFSEQGRTSVPWCLAENSDANRPLIEAALDAMKRRGQKRAWAAYRADWDGVRRLLESFGFQISHEVVNFVAERSRLPNEAPRAPFEIRGVARQEVEAILALDPGAFGVQRPEELAAAWWDSPYLPRDALFSLRDTGGNVAAVAVAVVHAQYADPAKIDAAMPCFRLGAIGTESERTKRVNGLFSYVAHATDQNHHLARWLLGEACRRFEAAGIDRVAAQCRSDRPHELAFYEAFFDRQKSFPIFERQL